MPDNPLGFRIGLNMAGAVSAGAYTAGVLDFLIAALDTWYAEREKQQAKFGNDRGLWEVPSHDVSLEVLSGASAGGMCAAMCALALQQEFDHVTGTKTDRQGRQPDPDERVNRLYESWVRRIDIKGLLGTNDLRANPGTLRSLLDCTPIERIADFALTPEPNRRKVRPWVSENLALILTVTNLRGIPYSVDAANQGSFEERTNYHADEMRFQCVAEGEAPIRAYLPLVYPPSPGSHWDTLKESAMATGAFPGMLAARVIRRQSSYYLSKEWTLNNPDAEAPGSTGCQTERTIAPAWDTTIVPQDIDFACVDGGVTNNNPFECARAHLVRTGGGGPSDHNPRAGDEANAAVISVAPFPGDDRFDPDYDAQQQTSLLNSLKELIPTFLTQARFQGENLTLIKDADVHSRFTIAPSDDAAGTLPSLLCASLGAFGGFLDERFRDRDYQLGRRNCQRFLEIHFLLPETNPLIAQDLSRKARNGRKLDSFKTTAPPNVTEDNDKAWYPIIPLFGPLEEEVNPRPRGSFKTTTKNIEVIVGLALERAEAILKTVLDGPSEEHPVLSLLAKGLWDLKGKAEFRQLGVTYLTQELQKLGQL